MDFNSFFFVLYITGSNETDYFLMKQKVIFKQYFIYFVVNPTLFINFNVYVYMLKIPSDFSFKLQGIPD